MYKCCIFLVLTFSVLSVRCEDPEDVELPKETEVHARQLWIQMDKDLKTAVSKIVRKVMPVVMKEVYKKDLSAPCLSSLLQFVTALKQSKEWAYRMLDSSGRFPEGFLSGALTSLGNYEECVNINVNETKVKLKGQYCYIHIQPPLPNWKPFTTMHGTVPELRNVSAPDSVITYLMTIVHNLHVVSVRVGICSPSHCSKDDINKLVQIIPEKLGININLNVKHCETKEPVEFTHSQVAVLCVLGVTILLLLLGTGIDVKYPSESMEAQGFKSTMLQIAKSFSIISNVRKVSDFTCPQEKLAFLYGVIFMVYYWVVISDTFMYVNYDTTANIINAFNLLKRLFYEISLNRELPLQILFFSNGLMTAYRWLKCPDDMNLWQFFLKKYWRYTPTYGLVIALLIVSPTWGSGPTWSAEMTPTYKNCRDNWWYNLLYINNFMDTSEVCLDHTWVYAVAAQLHVLSVFILIPLKMRPKIGLMVNFVCAVASLATVALTNVYYDLPPNEVLAFIHIKDRMFYAEHSYYRVYTHLAMYCCGIFVAYLVHEYPNLKISKKMCCFLWVLTFVGLSASFCVVHEWRSGLVPSPLIAAIYTSFSKVAEAAFMSWLSVACMTGYGGYVKEFLSWRPFHFLSRLAFIAYMMHVPIQKMVSGFRKTHFYLDELEIFYVTLNNAVATLIISYILYVAFEAPFLSLTETLKKQYRSRFNSSADIMTSVTTSEKPIKFVDKSNNVVASNIEQPKVWMNICEKSRC